MRDYAWQPNAARGFRATGIPIVLFALLALSGCGGLLQRAAPYDAKIETEVSAFSEAVNAHITKMQGLAKTEAGTYGENVAFYTIWKPKLESLRVHAVASDVGQRCGPEEITDKVIAGGYGAVSVAIEKANKAVGGVNSTAFDAAKDWAEGKVAIAKADLAPITDLIKKLETYRKERIEALTGGAGGPGAAVDAAVIANVRKELEGLRKEQAAFKAKVNNWNVAFKRADAARERAVEAAAILKRTIFLEKARSLLKKIAEKSTAGSALAEEANPLIAMMGDDPKLVPEDVNEIFDLLPAIVANPDSADDHAEKANSLAAKIKTNTPSFQGGCTSRMLTNLVDQFASLERVHLFQEDDGFVDRPAISILMNVPIQVILKVQSRKKELHERGLL